MKTCTFRPDKLIFREYMNHRQPKKKEAFFVQSKSCWGLKCSAANRRKTNMTSELLLSRQESFSNPTMTH